jgi:hypothetical protein
MTEDGKKKKKTKEEEGMEPEEDACKKKKHDEAEDRTDKADPNFTLNLKESPEVQRYDMQDAPNWMTRKFDLTNDGYLKGRAVISCVGVFLYQNKDGTVRRELRHPEEVFHPDSIASLKSIPLTNGHPPERVTAENIAKYGKGMTGDSPSYPAKWEDLYPKNPEYMKGKEMSDGYHLANDLIWTDPATIENIIQDGKNALSAGYTMIWDPTPGVWGGSQYDGVQRKIRYNHVAAVDKARAGDAARMRLDSADAFCVGEINNNTEDVMKTTRIDGVDYQAEAKVIETMDKAQKDLQTKTDEFNVYKEDSDKQISTLEAERDDFKAKLVKAEADLKEAQDKADDPARVDAAAKAKLELYQVAEKAGVEVQDGMTDLEIKKAVIAKVCPDVKLDEKDDTYIGVRFDIAREDLDKANVAAETNRNTILNADQSPAQSPEKELNVDEARDAYRKRLQNGWKSGGKE